MDRKEFLKKAKIKFGDKICVKRLHVETETEKNLHKVTKLSKSQIERYPAQAWLVTDCQCPNCSEDLFGILGSFTWGVVHGEGYCANCKKVSFRYYHYPVKNKVLRLLSVCGFSK